MLEDWFSRAQDRQRIRANPLGPTLERYIVYLAARGHSRASLQRYVSAAEHFGRWLGRRRLSRRTVQRFIHGHLRRCRCRPPVVRNPICTHAALGHLLVVAGVAPIRVRRRRGFVGDLLLRYEETLITVRGLAAGTTQSFLIVAQEMLRKLRGQSLQQLRTWTPERVARYVIRVADGHRASTNKRMASAIRSFLRFLLQDGWVALDLSAAVPTFAHWRLATLPETLHEDEVAKLTAVADPRTPLGRRDRAIVLCLSELGLRASDVVDLRLTGVDWTARTLQVHRRKDRESALVPMTRKLSDALRVYVRHGRPACSTPNLFVIHQAPVGKPLTKRGLCNMVLRLARRAGLGDRVHGTHILRHTFASRMLRSGASVKQIADLLGHESIDTTMIYAKVDFDALAEVALPWPGAKEGQP